MASDGTVEAIVAHGLIGSLAVATGAASMLLRARTYDPATEQWLLDSISEQSALVIDGMKNILDHATQSFLDAATSVALAAGTLSEVPVDERRSVLEALLRSGEVLNQILGGLVRGLPADVGDLFDELSAAHTGSGPSAGTSSSSS